MTKEQLKVIALIVAGIFIGSLLSMILYSSLDNGKYDYCVEWDGYIHRDNLQKYCSGLATNGTHKAYCDERGDDSIVVYQRNEQYPYLVEHTYQCSMYLKSRVVPGSAISTGVVGVVGVVGWGSKI